MIWISVGISVPILTIQKLILALKSPSEFTLQNGSSKFLPYFRSENWRHGSFPYIFYYFNLIFPNFSVFVIYSLACNVKKGKYKLVNYL